MLRIGSRIVQKWPKSIPRPKYKKNELCAKITLAGASLLAHLFHPCTNFFQMFPELSEKNWDISQNLYMEPPKIPSF